MQPGQNRRVIIQFIDGTHLDLEWPIQGAKDFLKFRDQIDNAMKTPQLGIEVEGNLMVIKTGCIKFFEFIPAPNELPPGIIRNARRYQAGSQPQEEA